MHQNEEYIFYGGVGQDSIIAQCLAEKEGKPLTLKYQNVFVADDTLSTIVNQLERLELNFELT